jgi:single-stranded DNA-binding protein
MNNFVFSGTLLRKPELRYTSNNQTPVCSSLLEFTERTKDATKSELKVVAWGKSADALHGLQEGAQVILEGNLAMNTVESPEGFKRKVAELNVSRIEEINPSQPKVASVSQKTVETEATEVDDEDDCPFD